MSQGFSQTNLPPQRNNYYSRPYYAPSLPPPKPDLPSPAKTVKIIFSILPPLIWVIALLLPAYTPNVPGVLCAAMGWSMLVTGNFLAFLAWFANLPFWTGYFLFVIGNQRKKAALILSAGAFVLSLGALTVSEVARNEGGMMDAASPSFGMAVWMSSMLLLALGSFLFNVLRGSPEQQLQKNSVPPQYPPAQNYPPQFPPSPQQQYPPPPPDQNPWK